MAGRGYAEEYSYAILRRWDNLNGRWLDHFNQDVMVEVIFSQGRGLLLCRTPYNGPQSFQCPIDGANITRTGNDVFEIASNQNLLRLYFRSMKDADIFQQNLGSLPFRDDRPQFNQQPQRQFNGGGPFQSHGQPQYNQPPPSNQQYGYDQQYSNQGQYDQRGYPQQFGGGQNQRLDQRQAMGGPGPGGRDSNQYNKPLYQNVPGPGRGAQYGGGGGAQFGGGGQFRDQREHQVNGGGAPYGGGGAPYSGDRAPYGGSGAPYGGDGAPYGGGGAPYGRNQGQYDGRPNMQNQQPGMNQGQRGGMQYGAREEYQQGGPPGRGVQDVPHRPKEAWGDGRDTRNNQPWDINAATAELTQAINECDIDRACGVIEQLEKLEKSQRVFNVQLEYFGEIRPPQVEEPVKDEKINEFRLKVAIERQCSPNENAIDIIIKAKEEDTIEQLVNLFETQYNIPGEVQRWIIKQQLASDKSKWSLKEFGVTKDGGTEQEVYLFVIQGMKERIKEEFLNKRQQQVEDDQRQQQQIAQERNLQQQKNLGMQGQMPDQFSSVVPNNIIPQQQQQQPYQQQQQHYQQQFDAQNQDRGYMDTAPVPNQPPPQNMGPGFRQDQRPMQAAAQPPVRQPSYPQEQYHPQQQQQQQQQQQRVFAEPLAGRYNPDPGPPPRDEYQPRQEILRAHQSVRQTETQPPPPQNNPPRGAAGGIQVFPTMPLQKTQAANEGPPVVAAKPIAVGQPEKPRGWNCTVCTFLNEPFRPGCKMCSADRPEGYEPPVDHVPSADEIKFIQQVYQ